MMPNNEPTAVFLLYASRWHNRGAGYPTCTGTFIGKNTIFSAEYYTIDTNYLRRAINFRYIGPSVDRCYFSTVELTEFYVTPTSLTEYHTHRSRAGLRSRSFDVTATGALSTSCAYDATELTANALTVKDPKISLSTVMIENVSGTIVEQYTCNIHIADKSSINLSSVTVLCEDKNGTDVFSVSTDINGNITEQTINYKIWTGTSETLVTYSPHKFTISKTGYQTLVLENITVDAPIKWHLELQPSIRKVIRM